MWTVFETRPDLVSHAEIRWQTNWSIGFDGPTLSRSGSLAMVADRAETFWKKIETFKINYSVYCLVNSLTSNFFLSDLRIE